MKQPLSSQFTWAYRYGIPTVLSILSVLVIVWYSFYAADPTTSDFLLAIFTLAVCICYARFLDKSNWVTLSEDRIIVSDGRKTLELEIDAIDSIGITPVLKPCRIYIRTRAPTIFGTKICFFPPSAFFSRQSAVRIKHELELLAAATSGGSNEDG